MLSARILVRTPGSDSVAQVLALIYQPPDLCGSFPTEAALHELVYAQPSAAPPGILWKALCACEWKHFLGRSGSQIFDFRKKVSYISDISEGLFYMITKQYLSRSFSCYSEEDELIVNFP